ncbi:MAG: hypothetical protein Q4E03_02530 [Trueperella sp.]|nr:hypothetical protein [Trueperella sp.]
MRAEQKTFKPWIAPASVRAQIGFCGAALLALGGATHVAGTAVVLLFLTVGMLPGWPKLLRLPNLSTSRWVMSLTAVFAAFAAGLGTVGHTAMVLTGAVIASFVTEIFRTDGRYKLVEQISGDFAGAIMVICASMWIHLVKLEDGSNVMVVAAIALAVGAVISAFDSPRAHLLTFINTTAFAVAVAFVMGTPVMVGVIIGLFVGLGFYLTRRAVRFLPRHDSPEISAARALIPHCALGLISYLVCVVLV